MAIDLRTCTMSQWSGRARCCRWCDRPLTGRRRHWCSDRCSKVFTENHHYSAARRATAEASRGPCGCPEDVFTSTRVTKAGETKTVKHRAHYICVVCGRCDRELGKLECNHITPRLGDRSSYSCLHHRSNLEMVCHQDHLDITKSQRALWDTKVTVKARKPAVRKTTRRTRPRAGWSRRAA